MTRSAPSPRVVAVDVGGTGMKGSVVAALERGEAVAARIWDDAIAALARELITYISLLAPEVIVIGGGLSRAGWCLFEPLRARVHDLLLWQREPRIVPAPLRDDATRIGAALLALRLLDGGGARALAGVRAVD